MGKAEIIDVNFRETRKQKSERIKTKVANKFYNFKYRVKQKARMAIEHPQETIATVAVMSVVYRFGRMIFRDIKPNSTDKLLKKREVEIYDPRTGVYLPLRHKMTDAQKLEYSDRRSKGESAKSALMAMHLLKRR